MIKITVTDKAASEVNRILKEQGLGTDGEKVYLRISVRGGGCSGFQHKLDLDTEVSEKDEKQEVNGVNVAVDTKSALYLDGVVVDFHDDLNKRGFSVINPAAKGTCGCGSSFSM